MDALLTDTDDAALVRAIEENCWTGWSNFGRWEGAELHQTPDATWYTSPIPFVPYNGVLRSQFDADAGRRIDEILAAFRARERDPFWLVTPSSHPRDLGLMLEKRGLVMAEELTGMAMPLAALPELSLSDGADVRLVRDQADRRWFAKAAAERWGVQGAIRLVEKVHAYLIDEVGVRFWIATLDGVPVAKAGVYFGGGVAGLYGVATLPEARGKGIATAVTLAALHDARRAGYEVGILHSTPMAVGLYERLGFKTCCAFHFYMPEHLAGGHSVHT